MTSWIINVFLNILWAAGIGFLVRIGSKGLAAFMFSAGTFVYLSEIKALLVALGAVIQ